MAGPGPAAGGPSHNEGVLHMHTYYNSADPACKQPFGAVTAGTEVTIRLTVPEELGYVDPHLVLTKDRAIWRRWRGPELQ